MAKWCGRDAAEAANTKRREGGKEGRREGGKIGIGEAGCVLLQRSANIGKRIKCLKYPIVVVLVIFLVVFPPKYDTLPRFLFPRVSMLCKK